MYSYKVEVTNGNDEYDTYHGYVDSDSENILNIIEDIIKFYCGYQILSFSIDYCDGTIYLNKQAIKEYLEGDN